MQTFIDTKTGAYYQFEDDVSVHYGYILTPTGTRITIPETLEPAEFPEPTPPSLEELRQEKLAAVTAKRWEVMTGGIELLEGIHVGTTVDDQNRITSVVSNASLAGLSDSDEVDFKAASGWVKLSIAEIKSIAGMIGRFVQECYTAERMHHEAIGLLGSSEDIIEYDITGNWPKNIL